MTLREEIAALSDEQLKQLCSLLETIQLKMRTGSSYASEIYMLSDEYSFSEADLLDTDSLQAVALQERQQRG